MPTAAPPPTTSRRHALRFSVAATIAGLMRPPPAIAAPGGDDELIAQCDEVTKLRAAMNAIFDATMGLSFAKAEEFQPDLDRTTTAYFDAVKDIVPLPAVSPAGVRAKAMILRDHIEEEIGICDGEIMGDTHDRLAWSLACDLTGDAAGVTAYLPPPVRAPAPLPPDAALLDLCRQFDADSLALVTHNRLSAAGLPTISEAELELVLVRWHDTLDEIVALPATTAAGIRAKAGAQGHALIQAVMANVGESFEDQAEFHERLAMSLVRDFASVPV